MPKARRKVMGGTDQRLGPSGSDPKYDLYHFEFSICSHKVRAVLGEIKVPWLSLELEPAAHENYKPDYVRLRLASHAAQAAEFATGWEGGSSVAQAGFDALVVPTLVDRDRGEVVADSLAICTYLARHETGAIDLIPEDLATEIAAEVDAVDQTPHVALLYGPNPDGDGRALIFRLTFKGEHVKKAAAVRREAAKVAGQDGRLDAAYAAKVAKEKAGSAFVAAPERMRAAIAETDSVIAAFSERLGLTNGPWALGVDYTLADVFWGVSLFRLEFLGYGWLYRGRSDRAALAAYADRAFARPSLASAVARWPSHPWARPVAHLMRPPGLKDRVMGFGSHTPKTAAD
ncbi:MAG: glutathione S-transferase family protein [Pseudomonadota bacterium]